jgi:hypothetical protein
MLKPPFHRLGCAVAMLVAGALPAFAAPISTARQAGIVPSYGTLPLGFEANEGQVDPAVRFVSRGRDYALFLTSTEAVLRLRGPQQKSQVVSLGWAGANRHPRIVGEEVLPALSHYFLGDDRRRWHTGVHNFGRVRYEGIYPGIDLIYHGTRGQLEYDLVLAPHADPGHLRLVLRGGNPVSIGEDGGLVVHTAGGDLVQPPPEVYQDAEGGGRDRVDGRYVLLSHAANHKRGNRPEAPIEVGFALGRYDPTRPLILDPVLSYSTFLGGGFNDIGQAIAVDPAGSAYLTGSTTSMTFPGASGGGDGFGNVFVTKLNAAGTAIVYSAILGGSSGDEGYGIAVDGEGEAYVTGVTFSPDFPGVGGGSGGNGDAFAAKLNAAGSAILWAASLGGSGRDVGADIALDGAGNAYVTGWTESSSFTGVNGLSLQPSPGGSGDAFVTEINAAGSAIVYSTFLGGSGEDMGRAVAVDAGGRAYVTGSTLSNPFPGIGGASIQPFYGGGATDAFVTEVGPNGTALVYSTYLGGGGRDGGYGIAVNGSGNAYVTGSTDSASFPGVGSGSIQRFNGGGTADAFVTKLGAQGVGIAFSTFLGGSGSDTGFGIAVDGIGNAYVGGITESVAFPGVNGGSIQPVHGAGGFGDAFVTEIKAAGTGIVYSTFLGGNQVDAAYGIAVDTAGNAYTTGVTNSTTFPGVGGGSLQSANAGSSDAFVTKIPAVRVGGLGVWILAPCRMVDTRDPTRGPLGGPVLGPFEMRTFALTGICHIPPAAKVVVVNVTVVQPTAAGYLVLVPGDQASAPTNSTINFTPGQVRANNTIVPLSSDGSASLKVYNQSPGTVHVLLDVNGFFQ